MAIVSSVSQASAQADGRKWVHEIHTDGAGQTYTRDWLAGALEDLAAARTAYATRLWTDLGAAEAGYWVERIKQEGSTLSPSLVIATISDVRLALRTAYQAATRAEAIMLADFLGTLTNAQLQTLFSMTAGQVTTMRSNKLTPAASLATNIRAAAGQ